MWEGYRRPVDFQAGQSYTVRITKDTNMPIIKTAISIQKALFQQVEEIAKEMKISQGRLFVLAVEEFIRRHQNKLLLEEINRSNPELDESEMEQLRQTQRKAIQSVAGHEW